jgi:Amidohydrolase family
VLIRISILLICAGLLPTSTCRAQGVVAFKGATIETVSKSGTIKNGTIIVRDGVIDAVGEDVDIPVNARIVDVAGQTVMPALVDAYHPVSLSTGAASQPASRTIVIRGRTFTIPSSVATTATPFLRVADNLDTKLLKRDLRTASRYGVGVFNVATRGYGQGVVARVTPDDPESCLTNRDGVLYLAVTNGTASLDVLRKGLKGQSSKPSSAGSSRSSAARTPTSSRSSSASSNPTTELWKAVKSGKAPLFVNANNAATILYVIAIQKEYKDLRLVLVANGPDIFQTIDALADHNVAIVLGASLDLAPRSRDRINVPKLLSEAGVNFAFSTSLTNSLSSMPDTPLFPVSLLVKTGLPRQKALEALTSAPAAMLGLDKSHGSIEKGKKANLLFFDGDPLNASSRVRQVLVEGKSVYED